MLCQALSLTPAFRRLSGTDEDAVIALLCRLNILEAHFVHRRQPGWLNLTRLEFIQSGVKLQPGEVDALWSATVSTQSGDVSWLVCCEVKTGTDDILEEQLVDTTNSMLGSARFPDTAGVIPLAVKRLPDGRLFIVEYSPVPRRVPHVPVVSVARQSGTVVECVPSLSI